MQQMTTTTPMMQQYMQLKKEHRDSILFFRLGDFYEMFESDAREASSILDLTLTKRHGIPMCGIPYHAARNYIARLLKAGKKIAICEQTEMPRGGKGIARREVVEVVTPGTVVDESLLEKNTNNYLVSLVSHGDQFALAYLDLSTSDFCVSSFAAELREERLKRELLRLAPRELIIQDSLVDEDIVIKKLLHEREGLMLNRYPDWCFDMETNRKALEKQFKVKNLKGFGFEDDSLEIVAAGIILDYVGETAKSMLPHIRSIRLYTDHDFLLLDESTQRNLELIRNLQDGTRKYTLLETLDYTRTSMGARKLKQWLLSPLIEHRPIEERHLAVDFFYHNQMVLADVRDALGGVLDLERLSARVAMDRANPKDLAAIAASLEGVIRIYELCQAYPELSFFIQPLETCLVDVRELRQRLEDTLKEEPAVILTEGNIIRTGFNAELDRLRNIKQNARGLLEEYLQEEKKKTGIQSLKLRYNKIIGYFLEVTKSYLNQVPEYFVRRQSLVGSERYTTTALGEKEVEINSASEKIVELEKELFLSLRGEVKSRLSLLQELATHISSGDVLQAFSFAATVHGFVKPEITEQKNLEINAGRHPVVEANLPGGAFIPNSIRLSQKNGLFMLLTGPNMAGKSTYLRQVAIIVLMAQVGSFIPAESARIGLVDRIFCRVGATDNLARGESTFLVEMNETANILRSATERSLLILDEVGRGTSTNDGLSIAWAVSEYILKTIKAKTLFATHYHELTSLAHPSLVNYSMEVVEEGGEIVFLKRIKKGPADSSYGIHVAQLAGLPGEVIANANNILRKLSRQSVDIAETCVEAQAETTQAALFSPHDMLINEIRNLKVMETTPLKALNLLERWQKELEEG